MKKILYILSAMGLIVSSCSKDIDTDLSSVGDVAASFTNATITRATDGVWTPNDQIGIFAYNEAGAIYNSYENIPYVTIDGGSPASFTPSGTTIYYPTGSSKLSFIAYSPYQESADDGFYEVNLSAQSTTAEVALIDLIVADDGAQYSNTNTEANLQLDHKLAKLTMTLKDGDGLDASDLAGVEVKLTNIATAGTYDLKGGTFTPSTANQTITPRTITADSKFEAIIFPYTVSTFSVEFYLPVTGKTYTWEVNGVFTSGKDHAYTVTIAESKISISSATLSGWGVNDSEDLVAEKVEFISSTQELKDLATAVNSGTTYEGVTFRLTQSIDLDNEEWTPIGTLDNPFNGTFDGGENTISGLKITTYSSYYAGLFGVVAGNIQNVNTKGSIEITSTCVGAIVGSLNSGSVSNCSNEASVQGCKAIGGVVGEIGSGASVINCSNSGTIKSTEAQAGGIVGNNNSGSISYCVNTGNIIGVVDTNTGSYIGGIVGTIYNDGTVSYCHNEGDVSGSDNIGGVAGDNSSGTITSCYNEGGISGSDNIGGVAGGGSGSITSCYNEGGVSGSDNIGGVAGSATGTITSCYNDGGVSGSNYVGGVAGSIYALVSNCYNIGAVSLTGDSGYKGEVVGRCADFVFNESSAEVANCYYLGDTAGLGVGTIENNHGTTYSVEAYNKSTADMTGGSFASTISSDFKEDYTAPNQVNNGYPILTWQ